MNSTDTETVADVLAEIRAYGAQPPPRCMWLDIADRVETAARRERDHAVEHATRHAEAVARDNCRDCVHNPNGKNYEGGNAAAMREALVQCELFLGNVSRHGHPTLNPGDKCTACDGVDELRGMVVRALSAPVRNCDLYATYTEAAEAHEKYASAHIARASNKFDFPMEFDEWLFAPAAERKGEGDGR